MLSKPAAPLSRCWPWNRSSRTGCWLALLGFSLKELARPNDVDMPVKYTGPPYRSWSSNPYWTRTSTIRSITYREELCAYISEPLWRSGQPNSVQAVLASVGRNTGRVPPALRQGCRIGRVSHPPASTAWALVWPATSWGERCNASSLKLVNYTFSKGSVLTWSRITPHA